LRHPQTNDQHNDHDDDHDDDQQHGWVMAGEDVACAAEAGRQLGVTGEWVEYWLFSGAPGPPCE
jgi:hypothetical protein